MRTVVAVGEAMGAYAPRRRGVVAVSPVSGALPTRGTYAHGPSPRRIDVAMGTTIATSIATSPAPALATVGMAVGGAATVAPSCMQVGTTGTSGITTDALLRARDIIIISNERSKEIRYQEH